MKKVKKILSGITHRVAQCDECDFYAAYTANDVNAKGICDLAIKHTKETSHTTVVETGHITHYLRQDAKRKSEAEDKKAFEKAIEFIAKNKENNE